MQIINKLAFIILSFGLCFTQPYINAQEAPAAAPAARQECPICLIEKNIHDFFRLECGHEFCRACLHNTIVTAIDNRELVQLRCANCPHAFSDDEIREISGADRLNAIQDIRFQQAMANMPGARQCPTPDCHHVFINEENRRVMYDCPACGNQYCANCLANHPGHVACAQNAHPNRDAWRDWPVADRKLRKPCPNCDAMIEKNGGCNYINCTNCHHEFCWLCFQPFWGEQHPEVHGGVFATEGDHLVASAGLGNLAIVQHFLENGTAVDTTDLYNGNTALIAAAAHGHAAVVDYLIAHGAQVNHHNHAGQTAIMLTHDNGIRHALLAHNAVEHAAVAHNEHHIPGAAHHEAAHGHIQEMLGLLLRMAVIHHNFANVQAFLAQGAPIDEPGDDGNTALILAAREGQAAILTTLLEHGANINARCNNGDTALIKAARQGHEDIIAILINHHADLNIQNNAGENALMEAVRFGYIFILNTLLAHHAAINMFDIQGNTPLITAIRLERWLHALVLIQHGAYVHVRLHGETPLIMAIKKEHLPTVQALIAHGADVNALDNHLVSPLTHAIRKRNTAIAHYLIQHGAQCTKATKAYTWAKQNPILIGIITGVLCAPLAKYCGEKAAKFFNLSGNIVTLIKKHPVKTNLQLLLTAATFCVPLVLSSLLEDLSLEAIRRYITA